MNFIPFNDLQDCIFDSSVTKEFNAFQQCLTTEAKTTVIIILALLSLLALAILFVNGLILYIYMSSRRMRKNYVYNFKLSTSAADLLIGIIYIPLLVSYILRDLSFRDSRLGGSVSRQGTEL